MHIPLCRGRLPGFAVLKSLIHTYSLSSGLVLGMVTASTKVLGNWPGKGDGAKQLMRKRRKKKRQ